MAAAFAATVALLVAAPASAAVSGMAQHEFRKLVGRTETMGPADTTPTMNENTDARDKWPPTWAHFPTVPSVKWFFVPPKPKGEKEPARPRPAPRPPPYEKILPTFDPVFEAYATKKPKLMDGFVLLCQSYYAMIYVRGRYDCSTLIVQEKVWDYYQRKDCVPTPNPEWFWTYPWVPEAVHVLHVRDRSSKRLIAQKHFYCVADAPPAVKFKLLKGMQWRTYLMPVPKEAEPNLIGYNLYTRFYGGWSDNQVAYVTYNDTFPVSRPVHPCAPFRQNNTFCVSSFDSLMAWRTDFNYSLYDALYTFRITPGPLRPYLVTHNKEKPNFCYWHTRKCDKMIPTGGDPKWSWRRLPEPPTTVTTTGRPTLPHLEQGQPELLVFQMATETPGQQKMRGYMEEDLFLVFLGLFLLLLLAIGPCMWFLGRRGGAKVAQDRWSHLAAVPGTVSVPLGHGGALWRSHRGTK